MANDPINAFLEDITCPDLTAVDFSEKFSEMVSNINNNFKKIASAPYLKGDKGDGILLQVKSLYVDASADNPVFSPFGKSFVCAIYEGIENIENISTWEDLIILLNNNHEKFGEVASYDNIAPENQLEVEVLYNINSKSWNMVSPYFYQDPRISILDNISDEDKIYFVDRSCAVYGQGELIDNDEVWDLHKYNIIPTLYYDENVEEFCWEINGERSGITAQGVAGQAGSNSSAFVCKGYIKVEPTVETTGVLQLTEVMYPSQSDDLSVLSEGDFVVAEFNSAGDAESDDIDNIVFGAVIVVEGESGNEYLVPYYINTDVRSLINNVSMRSLLDKVGYDDSNTSSSNVRGLFVRDDISQGDPQDSDNIHMMWADKDANKTLHIGVTSYDQSQSDVDDITTTSGSTLDVQYALTNIPSGHRLVIGDPNGNRSDFMSNLAELNVSTVRLGNGNGTVETNSNININKQISYGGTIEDVTGWGSDYRFGIMVKNTDHNDNHIYEIYTGRPYIYDVQSEPKALYWGNKYIYNLINVSISGTIYYWVTPTIKLSPIVRTLISGSSTYRDLYVFIVRNPSGQLELWGKLDNQPLSQGNVCCRFDNLSSSSVMLLGGNHTVNFNRTISSIDNQTHIITFTESADDIRQIITSEITTEGSNTIPVINYGNYANVGYIKYPNIFVSDMIPYSDIQIFWDSPVILYELGNSYRKNSYSIINENRLFKGKRYPGIVLDRPTQVLTDRGRYATSSSDDDDPDTPVTPDPIINNDNNGNYEPGVITDPNDDTQGMITP